MNDTSALSDVCDVQIFDVDSFSSKACFEDAIPLRDYPAWLVNALAKLEEISQLPDGWDTYNSPALLSELKQNAHAPGNAKTAAQKTRIEIEIPASFVFVVDFVVLSIFILAPYLCLISCLSNNKRNAPSVKPPKPAFLHFFHFWPLCLGFRPFGCVIGPPAKFNGKRICVSRNCVYIFSRSTVFLAAAFAGRDCSAGLR